MFRQVLLAASRSDRLKRVASSAPVARDVVARFVAGEAAGEAVRVSRDLRGRGLLASLDHLGEDTRDVGQAEAATKEYVSLLGRLADAGLAGSVEVSVKLSAVGQALGADGDKIAYDNAARVCEAARAAGTTVTLDMEDHSTVGATLGVLGDLRRDFPDVGAVIQAYLRRSEADCLALAGAGSRVRLCKGAYPAPDGLAFDSSGDVDRSYVRCLRVLMSGDGYPMVATHDPRLVAVAGALAALHGRTKDSFEYQMLYGIRPAEQRRLAASGARVRVYVPYGTRWYPYLVRRLAERPANLAFFLRSLVTRW